MAKTKVNVSVLELTEEEENPVFELLILNDNSTPVDFVEVVLLEVLGLNDTQRETAIKTAESSGEAVVGIYDDIVEALSDKEKGENLVEMLMRDFFNKHSEFAMEVRESI